MALVGYPGTKVLTSQPRVAAVCSVKGCWGSPKLKIHYLLFPDPIAILCGQARLSAFRESAPFLRLLFDLQKCQLYPQGVVPTPFCLSFGSCLLHTSTEKQVSWAPDSTPHPLQMAEVGFPEDSHMHLPPPHLLPFPRVHLFTESVSIN